MTTRLLSTSLAAILATAGCILDPGGPDYANLGVTVRDGNGALVFTDCFTLPVLLGSHAEDDWGIEGNLELSLVASRDAVTLRFSESGQSRGEPVTLTAGELRGKYSEDVVIVTSGGDLHVRLSSSCDDGQGADGGT
jgi:hypothetical protein